MRKLLLSTFVLISFFSQAQDVKPFKVNATFGYSATADYSNSDAPTKAGIVYSLEPQYRIIENLDLGVRLEQAFVQRPEFIKRINEFQSKAKSILSGIATANYTISVNSDIKPYAGIGVGMYFMSASTQTDTRYGTSTKYPLPAGKVLGAMARVGAKWRHLNLSAEYNYVTNSSVKVNATNLTLVGKNSYFSVKAGFTIGGGGQ